MYTSSLACPYCTNACVYGRKWNALEPEQIVDETVELVIRYNLQLPWLHRHRRLATCYERRPDLHDALLGIGCILISWRHLERSS
jgi:hypothetical protein